MLYNEYTNTHDFPEDIDFRPKDENGRPIFTDFKLMKYGLSEAKIRQMTSNALQAWVAKHNIPQSVRDEWNASQQRGEDNTTFWKRMRAGFQNASNTVKNFTSNTLTTFHSVANKFSNAMKVVRDNAGQISFETLMPLKPAMVAALKRKGFRNVSNNDSTKSVTVRFYNSYLKNQNSLENVEVTPEEVKQAIDVAGGIMPIVQAILKMFDQIKAKKDAGATLTVEEQKLLDEAEKSVTEDTKKNEDSNKAILYWVGGILAFIGLGKYLKWF